MSDKTISYGSVNEAIDDAVAKYKNNEANNNHDLIFGFHRTHILNFLGFMLMKFSAHLSRFYLF